MFSDASLPESSRMSSGFSVSCLHSSMVSLRKSGVSFWQCCFPIRQFKIDEVSFCADICHNWCISVKTLEVRDTPSLLDFELSRGYHQYRQEQSRYPGLSALCAFHAACRHLPAGCLCAGLIFLTKLLFPSICPTNTRPLGVMSRSSLNSMCIFFIALPPPVF